MHKVNARLSQRIAEEAQLLAEEKWIIDALRKIKQQRNSLQIERLHLENLRATVNKEELRSQITAADTEVSAHTQVSRPPPSETLAGQTVPEQNVPVTTLSQLDVPVAGIDNEICNNEKLNLAVTDSVFTNKHMNGFDMEEDEEDLDNGLEVDEDMENCLIEMNMLMQAKSCEQQTG